MFNLRHRTLAGSALTTLVLLAPLCSRPLSAQSVPVTAPVMREDSNTAETAESWANLNEPILARQTPRGDSAPEPADRKSVASQPEAAISAEMLRHPLSKKGHDLLTKALSYSESGNHSKAIQQLTMALHEPSAEPYAHGILGVEYLKIRQIPAAIDELERANAELPRLAAVHSNLGYALCQTGQTQQGLAEIQVALNLDQNLLKAHFLKGVILLDRGLNDRETWNDLTLAQKQIPTAHLALAIYYARGGQKDAAIQQLQNYTDLGLGISMTQAQAWLSYAMSGVTSGEALGLWESKTTPEPGL